MRSRLLSTVAILVGCLGATRITAQNGGARPTNSLTLPRIFGDGMVVQRGKPIVVWGWAAPSARVAVEFHGHTARATTKSDGKWTATLPSETAGGPFELVVRCGDARVALHDVLVGDVWVASGQSNMEFRLAQANGAVREIAAAHDSLIRHFAVPTSWSRDPVNDLAGGSWAPADSKHVGDFSAVAYFFARELRRSVHVPIGIINSTWGGSNIETWISRPAQHLDDAAWSAVLAREDAWSNALRDTLRARLGALPTRDAGLVDGHAVWADPTLDDSGWSTITVPAYWESQGYPGMDGVAWYRLAFDLSAGEATRAASVVLSAIDDDDITWVNGTEMGRTKGYNVARSYSLPPGALHAGRNVLTVRVSDGGGGGGINGDASLAFSTGEKRSLAGTWKFKVGEVSFQPDGQRINKIPSVLYNEMLHPLLPFPIKGVIWYQGESNANNAEQATAYRDQFRTLITSWRGAWAGGRDAFPFLWVQLPNFGAPDNVPQAQPAWAIQRESMDAALSLPNTGRAVTIDVGEAENIHPVDKLDVGIRLALVARQRVYGENVVAAGPTYRSHSSVGDTVVVEFTNVGGGLTTTAADGRVGGFALAGADGRFVWANARIAGNRVKVWSSDVAKPVAVRYAWANNPSTANLYNKERLPAAPFRTDRR